MNSDQGLFHRFDSMASWKIKFTPKICAFKSCCIHQPERCAGKGVLRHTQRPTHNYRSCEMRLMVSVILHHLFGYTLKWWDVCTKENSYLWGQYTFSFHEFPEFSWTSYFRDLARCRIANILSFWKHMVHIHIHTFTSFTLANQPFFPVNLDWQSVLWYVLHFIDPPWDLPNYFPKH